MIHLKPAPGAHVRDPKTKKLLTDDGLKVDAVDTYWHRRIADGSVVVAEGEALAAKAKPHAAKAAQKSDSKEKGV